MDSIETQVKNVLADVLALDVSDINDSTSKETVESWNSLNNLSVVMALEEEFGLQFSDDELVEMVSLPAILAVLRGKAVGA